MALGRTTKSILVIERKYSMEALQSALGTVFYSIVVFVAGAAVGVPLWSWVRRFFPWNKD